MRIVSTHLRLPDLLDYNISVVEPLEQARKEGDDGVYFVSPTRESVQRICDDFASAKPKYANVYIFFSSKSSDSVKNLIKNCPALVARLKALKEVRRGARAWIATHISPACPRPPQPSGTAEQRCTSRTVIFTCIEVIVADECGVA